jgi:glycosyltransferase involved in cell wall biosynthesis
MTLHDFWGICFKNILITNEGRLCDKKGLECIYCQRNLCNADGKPISLSERNRIFMQYLNMANLLISPSRYLIERFIDCGLSKDKTDVINYGIDLSRFRNIRKTKSNKIKLGYIGQIIGHKGIENLLMAVSLLSNKEKQKLSLFLIGSGEKLFVEYCKKLTKELKLQDTVIFYGKVANNIILKMYHNIDALIVPSIWPENSPVTILESLATGTPVLSSDIGGIPELIQDGVNGFLHKHNEPISLTTNIKKIIEQPQIINEMRKACLLKIQEHDLVNSVKKISEHYKRLIVNN